MVFARETKDGITAGNDCDRGCVYNKQSDANIKLMSTLVSNESDITDYCTIGTWFTI